MQFLRRFFARHPLLRECLIWAIPALAFGFVLRALLLSYLPYAYWGSDSRSYYGFTEQLLEKGHFSLYDKRRYLYLLLPLPVSLLPGSPLRWIAVLQHVFGLITLLPLAYAVRKLFAGWKAWIIPVTVLYAGLPILLWYEHEMLAEALFFHSFVWMVAGWIAFAPSHGPARVEHFWWFFGGLAAVILTKPAGRFLWPAVCAGLLFLFAWRTLRPRHWIALAALVVTTFTIGQDTQSAWLLYSSAFPLTRLDTPLHAEYKAEVADLVRNARRELDATAREIDSRSWNDFLKFPERQTERPLWAALAQDEPKKQKIYKALALEGIRSSPLLFLKIALGKIIASANPGEFRADRFLPAYTLEKYGSQYARDAKDHPARIRRLFALGAKEPIPPFNEIAQRLAPYGEPPHARWVRDYAEGYHAAAHLVEGDQIDATVVKLTPLAWWILLGSALAFVPLFFRPLGVPVLMAVSYLFGTFLVGGTNPRYFGAVWAIVLLCLCVPLDLLVRQWVRSKATR